MKNQNAPPPSVEGSVKESDSRRGTSEIIFLVTHPMELNKGFRRVTEMPFPLTYPSAVPAYCSVPLFK